MLFDTLVLISTIFVLLILRRVANLLPSLMACLLRWKENVNMQLSMKLRTDRNIIAAAMVLPFCLVTCRFRLYDPIFISSLGDNARLGATIGIFIIYIILRLACRFGTRSQNISVSSYKTATDSARTYFIILTLLLVATGCSLSFFNVSEESIRTAMIWISAVIYFIFIIRKTQIFLSFCSLFTSFLYLCALEILPTGVLIASAVIF